MRPMRKRLAQLCLLAVAAALTSACSTQAVKSGAAADAESAQPVSQKERLAQLGDAFWANRLVYPTGRYSPSWQLDASKDLALMSKSTPMGASRAPSIGPKALNPLAFTPLGPSPLGTGGGFAGRVNAVLSHPTNPAIAWLGADGGGIWKTTNCCSAATTWSIKTDIPQIVNSAIGDMTMDPNNPDVLYAGTGDLRFGSFGFGSNGLLKSTDGGETWSVKGETVFNPFYPPSAGGFPQYQAIGQVDVDPNNSGIVYVGTKTGLFVSYDAAETFVGPCLTNNFTSQRQDITGLLMRDLGSTTELVAAIGTRGFETTVQPDLNQNGANGIYRAAAPTSGCPSNWTAISRPDNGWPAGSAAGAPTPSNSLGRIDLAIAPSDPNVMYAQVALINRASPTIRGVWRTANGGETWTNPTPGDISGAGTQSWYNAGMSVSPADPNTVFLSAFRTFRSTTGGSAFTTTGSFPHVDHHARTFVAGDPNQALLGTDGGVYYAGNALAASPSWVSLNSTLNTIEFYSGGITANFATSPSSGAVGGAQDNSCMVSTWTGSNFAPQSWSIRNGGDGFFSTIEPILGNRWYYSSQNGAIVATSTAQGTSTVSAQPTGWTADTKSFLTNFDLYRFGGERSGCPALTGCSHIITGSNRVWESIVGGVPGSSYVPNSPVLTKGNLVDRSFINQVAYSFNTPTRAIVGTNDGNVWLGSSLGLNIANSAVWYNVTDGNAVLPNRPIMDVITDPLDPNIGYAAAGGFNQNTPNQPGHVFQVTCTTNCLSVIWRNVSGNLPNIPVNSIMVNPNIPRQVFAGSDWGLFYTDNVNANPVVWIKHAGAPSAMIWDMTVDRGFTTLALWTRSRGAWVWPLPTLSEVIFNNGFQ